MIKWLVFKASPKKPSKMAIPIRRRSLIGPKMKAIEGTYVVAIAKLLGWNMFYFPNLERLK